LGNACELSAEFGELGIVYGSDIVVERIFQQNIFGQFDGSDRKLDYFATRLQVNILFTGCFEVQN
jgi:hypothetical protein